MEVPIELCDTARVYKPDAVRRTLFTIVVIILYAVSLPYCYYTAGEPRRVAMIQAQKQADEKWAMTSSNINATTNSTSSSSAVDNDADGAVPTEENPVVIEIDVTSEGDSFGGASFTRNAAGAGGSFGSLGEHDEFGSTTGDEVVFDENAQSTGSFSLGGYLSSYFGDSKETKRAKAELELWQKEFKEKSGETISLPPEYLPSAWACLALFFTLTFHALFHLMCHWVVKFKALVLFKPARKVEVGCHVLVIPPPNRGSSALVPVYAARTGVDRNTTVSAKARAGVSSSSNASEALQVEFQRQKYNYITPSQLHANARKFPNGVFSLTAYPVNLPLAQYISAHGIGSDAEVQKLTMLWGKNHLAVAIPSFLEMLQLQLLSPLAIFQVFCALLWLLDEYWTYTIFTLVSVVIFEATTVFQRNRTQKMLSGMAPKPSPKYVFRGGKWVVVTTKELLPGDVLSLAYKKRNKSKQRAAIVAGTTGGASNSSSTGTAAGVAANGTDEREKKSSATSFDELIPCDCLLLRGSAVVNEASLTGESVPQMKEALIYNGDNRVIVGDDEGTTDGESAGVETVDKLDMQGSHRVNCLFSGCSLITVSTPAAATDSTIPAPPDGGVVVYVLRTGFGSSQGKLLQMIEFSQQSVAGDSWETGMALLMLFIFALIASGYVLNDGLIKKEKTTHELLLKCVIIITSVVPRQFPMQMAMAVNMALMALSKASIFCTEPWRVPLSGKVSHCLFDKTGTLTTDQLVPVGIVNHNSGIDAGATGFKDSPPLAPVLSATNETAMVLAACHSLVVVDEQSDSDAAAAAEASDEYTTAAQAADVVLNANLVGDPIELAAIKGIAWAWDAKASTATPDGGVKRAQLAIHIAQQQVQRMQALPPDERPPQQVHQSRIEHLQREIRSLEIKKSESMRKAEASLYQSIQVIQRHHFSSKLQRMSVVCRCSNSTSTSSSSSSSDWYCLVKGSPEALQTLMIKSSIPSWYAAAYENMARRGLRVLALAYKKVSAKDTPNEKPRSWVESDVLFGGFIAFECKIRADSKVVMKALLQSDHKVAMLTGDALLTSLHVANEVEICDKMKDTLSLTKNEGTISWTKRSAETGEESTIPFDAKSILRLASDYNLITTEENFLAAVASSGGKASAVWSQAGGFSVFARMSPQGKASIIRSIQEVNSDFHVFMCGDGGNDVGALKQADVGLALLAGHANANTTEELGNKENSETAVTTANGEVAGDLSAEDELNLHQKKMQHRNEALNKARQKHMKEFQARITKQMQAEMQDEIKRRTDQGDVWAMWTVLKEQPAKIKKAMNEENARFMAMHGQIWDPKKDGDMDTAGKTGIEQLMESMDSSDAGGLPMVRPGDASVAAPFTSRIPSVRAVIDLIRQGRCTLLSALMQQQIMMLESCIAAYTLSALSLHNARSSERQMMASSWLIMTAAVSFSYASPVDHMHPLRPLRSLFHPALIISTLGQAFIHICCMTLAVQWATDAMGPEALKEVTDFFKKAKANEIARDAHCGEDDFMCQMQAYWTAPFMPNLLNSVVFLVETSQMISVFFANYKGRPWMKGMLENHPLFLSVFACIGGVAVAAWEVIPAANEMLQLAPFPNDLFRYKVVLLVVSTIFGTLLWDRLCVLVFAPRIFRASMMEAWKTSLADFLPIFMTLGKVVAVLLLLGTGNILLIGAAIWWYRSYTQKQKEAEAQKLGV